jgi:DNA-binding PadR family transcriptional regulator
VRKYYAAAEKGLEELAEAQRMIRELYREVVEGFGPDSD